MIGEHSHMPDVLYELMSVECLFCHAPPGVECFTRTGKVATEPHSVRYDVLRTARQP